jgi:hypothetical protein
MAAKTLKLPGNPGVDFDPVPPANAEKLASAALVRTWAVPRVGLTDVKVMAGLANDQSHASVVRPTSTAQGPETPGLMHSDTVQITTLGVAAKSTTPVPTGASSRGLVRRR